MNYDFERGLLTSVSKYNNTGTEVSETDYSYQTPESPLDITAIKYDVNNYATNYAKYTIHTAAGPLVTQIMNKVFDLTNVSAGSQPAAAAAQIVTTNNTYNTAQHKLSQQIVHNSEGSNTTTNIKYLKDYALTTSGDSYTSALLALQNNNLNIPVETYTQFTPVNSSTPITTHADLILFGTFPNQGVPAPLQHLSFNSPYGLGVTDFIPSSISSSTSFQYDKRYYIITENDLGYDYTGALVSSDDGFHHVKTTLFDNTNTFRVRAKIKNASYDQVGIDLPFSYSIPGVPGQPWITITTPNMYNFVTPPNTTVTMYVGYPARNGEPSLTLPANEPLIKVLNKNPNAQNYIFSIWINSSSGGSFTVSLTDGTNSSSKSFTFDATTGSSKYSTGFEYCQVSIPVSSLSPNGSSPLTLNFSSNTAINFTDIMTYPDVADVVSYSYDSNQNQISSTDGNGVSTYYSYDALGRVTYVYDQDNNIIERKTYTNNNPAVTSPGIILSWSEAPLGTQYGSQEVNLNARAIVAPCSLNNYSSAVYTWDFGDGQTASGTGLTQTSHGYIININKNLTGTATYTCTVTISSPQNSFTPFSQSVIVSLAQTWTVAP